MQIILNGITVRLVLGDIADLEVDAVVNAANESLILGSGVAGAIRAKGGPQIQEECYKIGYCAVGNAVITSGGLLHASYVIHAVGPRLGEGHEASKLASATRAALVLAESHQLRSVALPAISSGVFGFPIERCAEVMLEEILITTFDPEVRHLKEIVMCLYDSRAFQFFADRLQSMLTELA